MIDIHPKICNLCGGKVIFTSNANIYGREYGSGKCYLCTQCGAYVGTHKPWPREAMGVLADTPMRKGKKLCHELFDAHWRGKNKASKKRQDMYAWLAEQMDIPFAECHFGYFNIEQLRQAWKILKRVKDMPLLYDKHGKAYFPERNDNE